MSKKNKNIDFIVKNAFDNLNQKDIQSDTTVFPKTWNLISAQLDKHNNEIDTIVKQVFNNVSTNDLPANTWDTIQDILDQQTVWKRVDKILTKRKRRLVFYRISGAVVILLLLLSLYYFPFNKTNSSPTVLSYSSNLKSPSTKNNSLDYQRSSTKTNNPTISKNISSSNPSRNIKSFNKKVHNKEEYSNNALNKNLINKKLLSNTNKAITVSIKQDTFSDNIHRLLPIYNINISNIPTTQIIKYNNSSVTDYSYIPPPPPLYLKILLVPLYK